uniref:NADH dehydrogenase subunit 6 n=1 Tax=Oulema tristis TaxID=2824129 RepID=UPI00226CD6EB|nr:NADH dehydrogenase subunit 6 [Oulema tristis]UZN44098.1 NADH dehydrogenase subunit 6 [Oulema tristis]
MMILMILTSMLFMFMKHPLSMGVILLSQTTFISLMTGMMQLNFWYSYIIFIIMIGGMLILFMYMTSVASNEKFKFSMNLMFFMISFFLLLIFMKPELLNFYLNLKIHLNIYNLQMSLNKYFNTPNHLIIFLIFFYLLITMIMVTKITKLEKGPLRQMN